MGDRDDGCGSSQKRGWVIDGKSIINVIVEDKI
jgi:hypothetical protein